MSKEDLRQVYLELMGIPAKFRMKSFSNYCRTDCNKKASEQVSEFGDGIIRNFKSIGNGGEGIYLWGETGVGKTHLVTAIAQNLIDEMIKLNGKLFSSDEQHIRFLDFYYSSKRTWKERQKNDFRSLRFISTREFILSQRRLFGSPDQYEEIELVNRCDFLIIDDLGNEELTDWAMHTIFGVIFSRYNHCLPFWITSNYSISKLGEKYYKKIDEVEVKRLLSRLSEVCLRVEVPGEDNRLIQSQK